MDPSLKSDYRTCCTVQGCEVRKAWRMVDDEYYELEPVAYVDETKNEKEEELLLF